MNLNQIPETENVSCNQISVRRSYEVIVQRRETLYCPGFDPVM